MTEQYVIYLTQEFAFLVPTQQTSHMTSTDYVPGVCNINKAEVAYRKKAMWFGYGVALAMFIALLLFGVEPWLRALLLFLPLYVGVIGSLQVRNKFCVSYGASGKQHADDATTNAVMVTDAAARKMDASRARRMNLQALAITVAVLLVTCLIYGRRFTRTALHRIL